MSCPPGEDQFTGNASLDQEHNFWNAWQREAEQLVTKALVAAQDRTLYQALSHIVYCRTSLALTCLSKLHETRVTAKYLWDHFFKLYKSGCFIAGCLRTFNKLMCIVSLQGTIKCHSQINFTQNHCSCFLKKAYENLEEY